MTSIIYILLFKPDVFTDTLIPIIQTSILAASAVAAWLIIGQLAETRKHNNYERLFRIMDKLNSPEFRELRVFTRKWNGLASSIDKGYANEKVMIFCNELDVLGWAYMEDLIDRDKFTSLWGEQYYLAWLKCGCFIYCFRKDKLRPQWSENFLRAGEHIGGKLSRKYS